MGRDHRIQLTLAACAWLALAGCQSAPADLREWRPTDHDHTDNPNSAQVDVRDGGGRPSAAMMGIDEVTLAAWKSNCTVCHGLIGRGDGPKGPSVHARDLSEPAWQAQASDEQIATSIKKGRGQMPAFDLPDSTIKGLVKLVRLLNVARMAGGPEPEGDGDGDDDESDAPVPAADGGASKPSDGGMRDAAKPRDAGARDAAKRRLDAGAPPKPPVP